MSRRRAGLLLAALLLAFRGDARGGDGPSRAAPAVPPRLVVIVVVDQMRADFLERFGARLAASDGRGFARLLREGAWWVDARHRHAATLTASGHATIGTGADPCVHGVVGTEWWERGSGGAKGRWVYCVDDPDATLFGAPGVGGGRRVGPKNLRADGLGDAMKAGLRPTPRVVGVSLKDRSAILCAGRRADAAFWFDPKVGGFLTSDRFAAWTEDGAAARRPAFEARMLAFDKDVVPTFVRTWTSGAAAAGGYPEAAEDDRPEEGRSPAFPHAPRHPMDLVHLETSPDGDDLLLAFLEALVPLGPAEGGAARPPDLDRLALGAREGATDLLCLSFSSPDLVGHRYGPESQEAADAFVRLDATLARFLSLLDARVGAGRWWLALTADHGVPPLPEWALRTGLDAGRVSESDVQAAVEGALGPGSVEAVREGNVYLAVRGKTPEQRAAMEAAGREALLALPGVWRVHARTQLLEGRVPDDEPGRGVERSFDAARSGDLVVLLRPYWVFAGPVPGTTHGSPWTYDARVPLILVGPGVRPGPRLEPAATVDLASTFCALLHLTPPAGASGRVLSEALDLDAWKATMPVR